MPTDALDFACALANHRTELKWDKNVSQSAVGFQMMSHHMSKPCETLPCSSDFHDTLLAPLVFFLIALPIQDFDFFFNKEIEFKE